jgi:hypothetical protein
VPGCEVSPQALEGWLGELGLVPAERAQREGVTSWDLVLDGRVRRDLRVTLILDPALGLVCWVHYAPPILSSFRVSYRKLLRWNDELPFVKFGVSEDDRPVLTAELPASWLDRDLVGLTLARLVTVCDLLHDASVEWLSPGARKPPEIPRPSRHERLLSRYADGLGELVTGASGVLHERPAAPDESAEPGDPGPAAAIREPDR